jgi:hypothetical protein
MTKYIEYEVRIETPGWPSNVSRRYFDTEKEARAFILKMEPILSEGLAGWQRPQFTIEKLVTTSNPFY